MDGYVHSPPASLHRELCLGVVRAIPGSTAFGLSPVGEECVLGCVLLETREGERLSLRDGDHVVFWRSPLDERVAIVLGRIGPGLTANPDPSVEQMPDELVIEAKQSLVLRVGDGTITIREDGRILIKGKDLVSHAKGMNRIRGGSVSIN